MIRLIRLCWRRMEKRSLRERQAKARRSEFTVLMPVPRVVPEIERWLFVDRPFEQEDAGPKE